MVELTDSGSILYAANHLRLTEVLIESMMPADIYSAGTKQDFRGIDHHG